jgi:hypothetical protein
MQAVDKTPGGRVEAAPKADRLAKRQDLSGGATGNQNQQREH